LCLVRSGAVPSGLGKVRARYGRSYGRLVPGKGLWAVVAGHC